MSDMPQMTMLIVDDDKNNVLALEKVFKKEGLNVVSVLGGREALDVCRTRNIDIVLTDMRMPGMDGLQLMDALDTVAPDVEIVLMTAYGTVESAVEAIKKGRMILSKSLLSEVQLLKLLKRHWKNMLWLLKTGL